MLQAIITLFEQSYQSQRYYVDLVRFSAFKYCLFNLLPTLYSLFAIVLDDAISLDKQRYKYNITYHRKTLV